MTDEQELLPPKGVRFRQDVLDRVDAWGKANRRRRGNAINELLTMALDAEEKKRRATSAQPPGTTATSATPKASGARGGRAGEVGTLLPFRQPE